MVLKSRHIGHVENPECQTGWRSVTAVFDILSLNFHDQKAKIFDNLIPKPTLRKCTTFNLSLLNLTKTGIEYLKLVTYKSKHDKGLQVSFQKNDFMYHIKTSKHVSSILKRQVMKM